MTHQKAKNPSKPLTTAVEFLLDTRQRQLAEALDDASRQGDREWIQRLRDEIDETNRLLQALRSQ